MLLPIGAWLADQYRLLKERRERAKKPAIQEELFFIDLFEKLLDAWSEIFAELHRVIRKDLMTANTRESVSKRLSRPNPSNDTNSPENGF